VTEDVSEDYLINELNLMLNLYKTLKDIFSWREAHSSTGRLVTGTAWDGMAQKTELSITRSIFELEA